MGTRTTPPSCTCRPSQRRRSNRDEARVRLVSRLLGVSAFSLRLYVGPLLVRIHRCASRVEGSRVESSRLSLARARCVGCEDVTMLHWCPDGPLCPECTRCL